MATYGHCNITVTDDEGDIVHGATITVVREAPGLPTAVIYSSRAGAALANPYVATNGADAGFYAAGGNYRVTAVKDSLTRTWFDVAVGTAQELDTDPLVAGLIFAWSTTTTDSDPGAGTIRANNASLASASALFVDDLTAFGSNKEAYLLSFDDSTNGVKGDLILKRRSDGVSASFKVSTIVDAAGYVKIGIGSHSGATSFTANDQIAIEFSRAGDAGSAGGGAAHNKLHNGDFQVWQRGTSFRADTVIVNNDNAYLMDRWKLLADGNDIVDVSREATTIPSGGLYACALDVETINKKFAIWQILEQKDCVGLIGNTAVLSFKMRVSSTTKLDNIKAAIVSWSGTADAPTSDPISAWNVEGTAPTLVANYTYENTPANLNPTTSFATYSVSGAIDTASCKNIGVLIWSDVTDTTLGDFVYITDVQLELGSSPTTFARKCATENLAACLRYFYRRQSISSADYIGTMQAINTTTVLGKAFDLPVPMFRIPTITLSAIGHIAAVNTAGSAANAFSLGTFDAPTTVSVASDAGLGGSSGITAGSAVAIRFNTTAGFIDMTAELP